MWDEMIGDETIQDETDWGRNGKGRNGKGRNGWGTKRPLEILKIQDVLTIISYFNTTTQVFANLYSDKPNESDNFKTLNI